MDLFVNEPRNINVWNAIGNIRGQNQGLRGSVYGGRGVFTYTPADRLQRSNDSADKETA